MKQGKTVLKRKKVIIRQRQRKVRISSPSNSTKNTRKQTANQYQQQNPL